MARHRYPSAPARQKQPSLLDAHLGGVVRHLLPGRSPRDHASADPAVLRHKILETGAILLAAGVDPPDVIKKTLIVGKTDSGTETRIDPERPGVSNLLTIYMAATGASHEDAEATSPAKATARSSARSPRRWSPSSQRRYAELRAEPRSSARAAARVGRGDPADRAPHRRTRRSARWASATKLFMEMRAMPPGMATYLSLLDSVLASGKFAIAAIASNCCVTSYATPKISDAT
jgi:hypothetical protein